METKIQGGAPLSCQCWSRDRDRVTSPQDRTSLFRVMARTSRVLRERCWGKELVPLSHCLSSRIKNLGDVHYPAQPWRLTEISSHGLCLQLRDSPEPVMIL